MRLATDAARWAVGAPLIRRQAIRLGEATYFAYQGDAFHPRVGRYARGSGQLDGPYQVGMNPLTDDAHGTPSLAAIAGARLHCAWGCHVSPLLYARSLQPEDPSAWEPARELAPSATYPTLIPYSSDDLSLFFRAGGHTANWQELVSTDGGANWSTPIDVLLGEEPRISWYCGWRLDATGTLHAAWCWQDDTNLYGSPLPAHYRYSIYYMRRAPGDVWRNVEGTALPMPLDKSAVPQYCKVFGAAGGSAGHTCTPAIAPEDDGTPNLLYTRSAPIDDPDVYTTWRFQHARWEGGQWVFRDVLPTDNQFDGCDLRATAGGLEAVLSSGGTSGTPENTPRGSMDLRGGYLQLATFDGSGWSVSLLDDSHVYDFPTFDDAGDVLAVEMNQDLTRFRGHDVELIER